MHHALLIEEIILNIFSHLFDDTDTLHPLNQTTRLARTCKAFRDPALNRIWANLYDLTPLVTCLSPESWVFQQSDEDSVYSLKKPLEHTDWDTILSYAHRVRTLRLNGSSGLSTECIEALSNPPVSTGLIFSNLRIVWLNRPAAAFASMVQHFISPSVSHILLMGTEILGAAIHAFGEGCPFVTGFTFFAESNGNDTFSDLVCHWQNLRSVDCYDASPNIDAFSHLSRLRGLRSLEFHVQDAIVDQIQAIQSSTSMFTFSALRRLNLVSQSLTTITRLFCRAHFPVVQIFNLVLVTRPSLLDVMPFLVALQEACAYSSLNRLILKAVHHLKRSVEDSPPHYFTFDRLHPLTVFANIKHIILDVHSYGVDLNERELLTLASSWPHLEIFQVGQDYDWSPSSGITPEGFLQLLEKCRSLQELSFILDTRHFTTIPQGHPWRCLSMPESFFKLHVLNSPIEKASIDALAVFFHVAPHPFFKLETHWNNRHFRGRARPQELCHVFQYRWEKVEELARDLWEERMELRLSLESLRAVGDA